MCKALTDSGCILPEHVQSSQAVLTYSQAALPQKALYILGQSQSAQSLFCFSHFGRSPDASDAVGPKGSAPLWPRNPKRRIQRRSNQAKRDSANKTVQERRLTDQRYTPSQVWDMGECSLHANRT